MDSNQVSGGGVSPLRGIKIQSPYLFTRKDLMNLSPWHKFLQTFGVSSKSSSLCPQSLLNLHLLSEDCASHTTFQKMLFSISTSSGPHEDRRYYSE